ncbi:DnaJ C-terminal domain-containing protein [Streptomyces scopuliridis]|uniref:DnaJ C-terminal domain-containing protein n=1 Tax=Streptomyces scopuliridis TaxID=452529 RepID=UPI00369515B2
MPHCDSYAPLCPLRIPAGVRDGQRRRMKRLGGPGSDEGEPGDLYVTMYVTQ